jgi:hypothetical protein
MPRLLALIGLSVIYTLGSAVSTAAQDLVKVVVKGGTVVVDKRGGS